MDAKEEGTQRKARIDKEIIAESIVKVKSFTDDGEKVAHNDRKRDS